MEGTVGMNPPGLNRRSSQAAERQAWRSLLEIMMMVSFTIIIIIMTFLGLVKVWL